MTSKRPLQIAALPFRLRGSAPEVLLITSRDTGRWIIPKGWPHDGRGARVVAAREAFEEAGLKGRVRKRAIGTYRYAKRLSPKESLVCRVTVFLMEVKSELDDWPEKAARVRRWLAPADAAALVEEPELGALILNLAALLGDQRRKGADPAREP